MSQIIQLVDDLPLSSPTTYLLQGLDFVVPGQWENHVGFEELVRAMTGEYEPSHIEQIIQQATTLYDDQTEGYQRAVWLYRLADKSDAQMAGMALANKASQSLPFLACWATFCPKPNRCKQSILA